jgi:membrane carboxypeptidase/penicillin-binding protein PbpC
VQTGWTFSSTAADSFTYSGAAVTNTTGSTTITVTIIFPATEDEGGTDPEPDPNAEIPIGNPSVKLYLNGGETALAHNGESSVGLDTGNFTVSIAAGNYTEITWRVNGNPVTQAQGKTFITLRTQTAGPYRVTVEAVPAGGSKNSGSHTFVVE